VRVAKELLGSIENAVQPAPRPSAPVAEAPAQQPAPVTPPAAQPPAPQPEAKPNTEKETNDLTKVQEELRVKKRELTRLKARYQHQGRMPAVYRSPTLAKEISKLEDDIKKLEDILAKPVK
jgi:hypothetical protein